jgi:type II secretory pathway predicted ATPase ExeA
MYARFYNLKEKPFHLTPSSRLLYLGEIHKEALALLTYGVTERKGIIVLTGELGTGKTTMLRVLLENLDERVQYVYLTNPLLSSKEFMDYIAFSTFGKKVHFKSKAEFLIVFEEHLKKCLQFQKNFILIIDDAHKLSFDLLEEIRLLSNMETADEKLINIFLIGQPQLNQNLREPKCRALLQRISARYHVEPLDIEGTREYIMTRLKLSGAENGGRIFSRSSINSIYEYSKGYPRMINIIANNALLLGYSRKTRKISPSRIKECYQDLHLETSTSKSIAEKSEFPEMKKIEYIHPTPKRHWKWIVAISLMLTILISGISEKGQSLIWQLYEYISLPHQYATENIQKEQELVRIEINREKGDLSSAEYMDSQSSSDIQIVEERTKFLENNSQKKLNAIENRQVQAAKESFSVIDVKEGFICRYLVDRAPIEIGNSFNNSVNKVYCFTRVLNANQPIEISHAWYFGDREKARVNLMVKSSNWRTFSSKYIKANEVGDWHVDVLGPQDEVLLTLPFEITR